MRLSGSRVRTRSVSICGNVRRGEEEGGRDSANRKQCSLIILSSVTSVRIYCIFLLTAIDVLLMIVMMKKKMIVIIRSVFLH